MRVFHQLNIIDQSAGNIAVAELGPELPFIPKCYFLTGLVPSQTKRGEYVRWLCHQFTISMLGSIRRTGG